MHHSRCTLTPPTELAPWFYALDRTNYPNKTPRCSREIKGQAASSYRRRRSYLRSRLNNHMNRTALASYEMAEQLASLTSPAPCCVGWLQKTRSSQGHRRVPRWDDQIPSLQTSSAKDVRSLVSVMDELGNAFGEDIMDLAVLDTKEKTCSATVQSIRNVKRIGQEQFQAFTRECLVEWTKPIYDAIRRNKLKVFSTSTPKSVSKGKQQVASLKNDLQLFSRLYVGCQMRGGNLHEILRQMATTT